MTPPPDGLGLQPRHPLTGGHRNAVWLCDGPHGPVVAKSTRRTEAQLRWLTPLHMAARAAGFQVPALLQDAVGNLRQQGWTVEPWIEGRAAQPRDMAALAPRIRAFHTACPPLPQRPGFCTLPELTTQTRSGDIDLTVLTPDLLARLRSAWVAFADAPAQAIHGDLGPGNVILTATGPCLIDWDEARVDLPFLDLLHSTGHSTTAMDAHLALEIASCWHAEPEHARNLLNQSCFRGNAAL